MKNTLYETKSQTPEGRSQLFALVTDMKAHNAILAATYFEDQRRKEYQTTYFENAAEIEYIEGLLAA